MKAPLSRPLGFTLVELLVAMTVVLLVVGVGMAGFLSQQRVLMAGDLTRVANESSRDALVQMEGSLRQAGWGIDPRFAIDVWSGTSCAAGQPCRDHTDAPDELAFVSRNPRYQWLDNGEPGCATPGGCFKGNAWAIKKADTAGTPKTVTVTLEKDQHLDRGRIVLATCPGGQNPVMFTLADSFKGSGADEELKPVAANDVPYNDFNSLQPCHASSGAGLFLVDRFRYFVSNPDPSSNWLMLDLGLDLDDDNKLPPDDTDDLIPVARNVEDMQVAYLLQPGTAFGPPDSDKDWIIGNDRTAKAEEPDRTAAAPDYSTPSDAAARFNLNPANVRGVRVSLTLRSKRADPSMEQGWPGDTVNGAENMTAALSKGGGYRRYVSRTEITLQNMQSRANFTF